MQIKVNAALSLASFYPNPHANANLTTSSPSLINLPILNRSTHMNFVVSLHIYLSPHPIIYTHTHHNNYFSNNHHFLHIIISQLFSRAMKKMMMSRNGRKGDAGSWLFGVVLMGLILVGCIRESCGDDGGDIRGKQLLERPCDEIYVVGEGETLHSISHKCNDPFIVERNPHVHDPDDVFPGLVIKIIPTNLQ